MKERERELMPATAAPGQHQSRAASFFTAFDILQSRTPNPTQSHPGKASETISQPKRIQTADRRLLREGGDGAEA